METRRLQMLVELARLGSMRQVADVLGTTTSSVSQQIAALARDTGATLIEPDGRRVRLTPAGRRLAGHAVTILEAVDAARLDLDPTAEPAGTVQVAAFATAIRRAVLPIAAELLPDVKIIVGEHQPPEALARLATDAADLAITYDYNLAPAEADWMLDTAPLWSVPWALGVPAEAASGVRGDTLAVFGAFRDHDWIADSRHRGDDEVIRTVASMAGFEPRITHRSDNLDVVEDLIARGMGVGMLPGDRPEPPGVAKLPLAQPDVVLRAYAHTRRGRRAWPPLALVLDRLGSRR